MLWLWAGNVRYFEWRNMRYDLCFSPADQRFLLSSRQILQVWLLLLEGSVQQQAWVACMCGWQAVSLQTS